jgi:hypothetical protein
MQQSEGAIAAVFRAHLDALEGELRGERREDRLRGTVDELMRVQAVLAPGAEAAAACLDGFGSPALVARLREMAHESFSRHRGRIERIRAGESSRAGFVATRAQAKLGRKR